MNSQLHHVALNVSDLDWHLSFFQKVFHMDVCKKRGAAPERKVWFSEGIQLNECIDTLDSIGPYDHISIAVSNISETVRIASEMGIPTMPDRLHWLVLPNGVKIELVCAE